MAKVKELPILDGQEIRAIYGRGTFYSPDDLKVMVGDEEYRMNVREFLKITNDYQFRVIQKRSYKHLELIQKGE